MPDMPKYKQICVIFITQHLDEYRVIYKSNGEWVIDAPESSISGARHRAEHCMQALYLHTACKNKSVRIYEVSITSNLYQALLNGLHNYQDVWQHYLDTAAKVLNTKNNVSMASFVSDDNGDSGRQDPYLFVISSNMQTGQHYMDTVELAKKSQSIDTAIIYKISDGKPRLYIDQAHQDNGTSPLAIDILHQRPAISA